MPWGAELAVGGPAAPPLAEEVAVGRELLHAVVARLGDVDVAAGRHRDRVRGDQLALAGAASPHPPDLLAGRGDLFDAVAAGVGDVDVLVRRRDRDGIGPLEGGPPVISFPSSRRRSRGARRTGSPNWPPAPGRGGDRERPSGGCGGRPAELRQRPPAGAKLLETPRQPVAHAPVVGVDVGAWSSFGSLSRS